jgi:hypothetical protein
VSVDIDRAEVALVCSVVMSRSVIEPPAVDGVLEELEEEVSVKARHATGA